jgi:nitrate reductase NapE component
MSHDIATGQVEPSDRQRLIVFFVVLVVVAFVVLGIAFGL